MDKHRRVVSERFSFLGLFQLVGGDIHSAESFLAHLLAFYSRHVTSGHLDEETKPHNGKWLYESSAVMHPDGYWRLGGF